MNDPFWLTFLSWHLRTEHPWDAALHEEAFKLNMQGMLRDIYDKVFRQMFVGDGVFSPTGLRSILRDPVVP